MAPSASSHAAAPQAPLFDTQRLTRNRRLARDTFDARLFHDVAARLVARLEPLTLSFPHIVDLSPAHTPGLGTYLKKERPHSVVRRASLETLAQEKADLVLCPLQLHWENDPLAFLKQLWMALKPGGLMLTSFWGGNTLTELRHVLAEVDFQQSGQTYTRISPMIPLEQAALLLQQSPFVLGVADHDRLPRTYDTLKELIQHLRHMGEQSASTQRSPHMSAQNLQDAETLYRHNYGAPLPASFQLITLTGWRDGPDIPKPLRRGSASTSLKEALEKGAPEKTGRENETPEVSNP